MTSNVLLINTILRTRTHASILHGGIKKREEKGYHIYNLEDRDFSRENRKAFLCAVQSSLNCSSDFL